MTSLLDRVRIHRGLAEIAARNAPAILEEGGRFVPCLPCSILDRAFEEFDPWVAVNFEG